MKPKPPADIWDFLSEIDSYRHPPPNSVTTLQYATRMNITLDSARHQLLRLERAGKLRLLGKFGPKQEKHYGIA